MSNDIENQKAAEKNNSVVVVVKTFISHYDSKGNVCQFASN